MRPSPGVQLGLERHLQAVYRLLTVPPAQRRSQNNTFHDGRSFQVAGSCCWVVHCHEYLSLKSKLLNSQTQIPNSTTSSSLQVTDISVRYLPDARLLSMHITLSTCFQPQASNTKQQRNTISLPDVRHPAVCPDLSTFRELSASPGNSTLNHCCCCHHQR